MTRARHRAVFLDRDGVINYTPVVNGKPVGPRRIEDFRVLPGVAAAVRRLKRAGFFIVVVTNQPDIGNGLVTWETVTSMHARIRRSMPIDDLRVCPHSQGACCSCRKPKPGMLRASARANRLNLRTSYMIGDRHSDVLAGGLAGCYTVFIRRGYAESRKHQIDPDFSARSLPEAARLILLRRSRGL